MASWTRQDVKDIAPEFTSLSDATLDRYVGYAALFVNEEAFSSRKVFAGSLMTAHLLTLFPPAGFVPSSAPAGPVVSQSAGDVSVTYAVAMLNTTDVHASLAKTKFGLDFQRITRLGCFGVQVL